jgi:phosphoribosylaminoimidazolecarboxamide formyltransferase/IMP cyclohydrolase
MAHRWQAMLFFLSRLCTIGKEAGITAVIQPGGSIKTKYDYCNENKLAMVFTGTRHFKH